MNIDRERVLELTRREGVRAAPAHGLGFGPFFMLNQEILRAEHGANRYELVHLGGEYDELIRRAFEAVREGLSVDRFLSDPRASRRLKAECLRRGLDAPEVAINLRLLAMRKRSGGGAFRETDNWARSGHLIDSLGPGVETSMIRMQIRFGASVDDMLAHPGLGREFVKVARGISPGGNTVEYKLCALHIRKSRHLYGRYREAAIRLRPGQLTRRWVVAGSPLEAVAADFPNEPGLAELRSEGTSLYIMRAHRLREAVETSFGPQSVEAMLGQGTFLSDHFARPIVRTIGRSRLPKATPKEWELALIHDWRPVFNWPVSQAA